MEILWDKKLILMLRPLLFFVFAIVCSALFGQTTENKSFKKAQKLFYQELFEETLEEYEEALLETEPSDLSEYQMEICSLLTDHRSISVDKFLTFQSSFGETDKFYYYWLGRIYFRRYNFPQAIESWARFLRLDTYKSEYIIRETKIYMDWAQEALEFYQSIGEFKVNQLHLDINSTNSEFSPVLMPDGYELLFVSNRISGNDGNIFNAYKSINDNGVWSSPRLISFFGMFDYKNPDLNYVRSRDQLFFFKGEHGVDLYFSQRSRTNWGDPLVYHENIPINRLESHFHINEDKNMIIYGIYRKVKPYDMDLYVTHRDAATGKWSRPELFSPNISSDADENYPYLTRDGKKLYFSSRGFGSVGGYDVFMSTYDSGSRLWSLPIHLPYPINTTDDDIQYKIFPESEEGFLVSDRFGTNGRYDIYSVKTSFNVKLLAAVRDTKDRPVDDLSFEISLPNGTTTTVMTNEDGEIETELSSNQEFKISLRYRDQVVKEDSIITPKVFDSDEVIQEAYVVDLEHLAGEVPLPTVRIVEPVYEELSKIAGKFRKSNKAVISNLYFETDNYFLRIEDREKLEPLVESLNKNPTVRVEIAGHTDNVGDPAQNKRLSYLRANSVADYLIERGISEDRIEVNGYGDTRPIASNDDEADGRELNRRIEVVVLESKP